MRIAFFSESYKPYLSGVTNSLETLKIALEKRGHSVIIFCPDYPGAGSRRGIFRYPSIPAPYPGYRLALPWGLDAHKILKTHRIDVIHTHSPYQLGHVAMRCASSLGIPLVFTMHTMLGQYSHYVPLIPQSVTKGLTSAYVRWFCNRCDAIIAPTSSVESDLKRIGVWAGIHVVPTGEDLSAFDRADGSWVRRRYGLADRAKLLLFVGRLAREKNIPFLLSAFRSIRSKRDDVHLLIAARGPLEKYLRKIAGPNVIFAGQVEHRRVPDLCSAADVFVFSSLTETQGLVLAEAMAAGLPQVAVDAQGVSDVVIDGVTGFLTPLKTGAFSKKVLELLDDRMLRSRFSRNSRKIARKQYSSQVFAKKIEQVYLSVL